jgi:hypothetical protein
MSQSLVQIYVHIAANLFRMSFGGCSKSTASNMMSAMCGIDRQVQPFQG